MIQVKDLHSSGLAKIFGAMPTNQNEGVSAIYQASQDVLNHTP